jgi:YfiH family protein
VLPAAGDGFVWTEETTGPALRCAPLGEVAAHLFSTRALALERPESDGTAWRALAGVVGVAPGALRRVRQVHGTTVACYRAGDPLPGELPAADIVMTDDPALAVAVQVADCVPLLLADRRTGAVAAAHAGWRGTAAGVAGAAVAALARAFGARAGDLVAAAGPSIGPCCYEVGEEVREAFRQAGFDEARIGRWFADGPRGRPHLDLWRATADQLEAAGVAPPAIHLSRLCTATFRKTFWSYRADGPGTGRLAGVIRMR